MIIFKRVYSPNIKLDEQTNTDIVANFDR